MTDSHSAADAGRNPEKASRIAKLFDIRLIVGGLLSLYGLILVITGLVENRPQKSGGMHLNLWTGIGMLVVGMLMLAWMRLRPLEPPEPLADAEETGPRESRAE
jgi:hypothetical protein